MLIILFPSRIAEWTRHNKNKEKDELNDFNDRQVSKSTNFEYLCDFPGAKPHVDYDPRSLKHANVH